LESSRLPNARVFLKSIPFLLTGLIAVGAAAWAQYASDYYILFFSQLFMYLILTVSWATFSGATGYISLSSAAFFGIGLYVTAILGEQLPLLVVILLGGFGALLFALIAGFASLRIRGIYFAIFTLGLSEALKHLVNWWETDIEHTVGRWPIAVNDRIGFYILLFILAMTVVGSHVFRGSKFGLALRSIGEEEEAADHVGINVNALKILTFAAGAFSMGAAGATIATQKGYIDSASAFDMFYSFMPALMALFGGIGTLLGWILGSVFFSIVTELLQTRFPYYYMLIFGVLVVLIILFFPSGLLGMAKKWRKTAESED
jgi:branched-chain amino acid transport system permease protein